MDNEPLALHHAKRIIRAILESGNVAFTRHAREEMENDGMIRSDVLNVLRAGLVERAEFAAGTWRYRVRTQKFYVVVLFRSETELVVVTTWRLKR